MVQLLQNYCPAYLTSQNVISIGIWFVDSGIHKHKKPMEDVEKANTEAAKQLRSVAISPFNLLFFFVLRSCFSIIHLHWFTSYRGLLG